LVQPEPPERPELVVGLAGRTGLGNFCSGGICLFHFQNGDETSENAQSGKGKKIVTIVLSSSGKA
jgi:hypothetical protein